MQKYESFFFPVKRKTSLEIEEEEMRERMIEEQKRKEEEKERKKMEELLKQQEPPEQPVNQFLIFCSNNYKNDYLV